MKRSFADILQDLDGERARKLACKIPEWAAAGVEVPSALSLEQCSSSATARYKVSVAQAAEVAKTRYAPLASRSGQLPPETSFGPHRCAPLAVPPLNVPRVAVFPEAVAADVPHSLSQVIDLTCGLGVDSWAFSQVAERVVSYERDAALCEAARRNFARLGADNIEVRCETVNPETELPEADLIYADPARRNTAGRKVFLLEDCTPDILTLLPMLLEKAPAVLLKLSPMADLTMLAERQGPALREIHVVEYNGEVKELLCLLFRNTVPAEPDIVVTRLSGESLRFTFQEERGAEAVFAPGVQPGGVLLEPCPALLKAGAFRLPCSRWGLLKLAQSTHLYTGSSLPKEASPWFKVRTVREVLPFGATSFKQIRQRWPHAEVTARNLPLGSAELQKKMGVAPGGDVHIFGCRLADGGAVLIVCGD